MNFIDIAWSELDDPMLLATVVQILMFFLAKPIIGWRFECWWLTNHPGEAYPNPWKARDLTLTISTFVAAWLIAFLRLGFVDAGESFMLGLVAGAASAGTYEGVKNIFRVVGLDISKFSWREGC